jgi:hypothetical protein
LNQIGLLDRLVDLMEFVGDFPSGFEGLDSSFVVEEFVEYLVAFYL